MGQKHPKFLTCWFHKWSDLLTNLALVITISMLIVTAQQASEIPRFEMGHPVVRVDFWLVLFSFVFSM